MNIGSARICKRRGSSNGKDLILGKDLGNILIDGMIYEILDYRGISGDIIIRELGPSYDLEFQTEKSENSNLIIGSAWNFDVNTIITEKLHQVLMTNEEFTKIINNETT